MINLTFKIVSGYAVKVDLLDLIIALDAYKAALPAILTLRASHRFSTQAVSKLSTEVLEMIEQEIVIAHRNYQCGLAYAMTCAGYHDMDEFDHQRWHHEQRQDRKEIVPEHLYLACKGHCAMCKEIKKGERGLKNVDRAHQMAFYVALCDGEECCMVERSLLDRVLKGTLVDEQMLGQFRLQAFVKIELDEPAEDNPRYSTYLIAEEATVIATEIDVGGSGSYWCQPINLDEEVVSVDKESMKMRLARISKALTLQLLDASTGEKVTLQDLKVRHMMLANSMGRQVL